MTTLAKIEANRRNALLSTGPRTTEGKLIVGRNSTSHGIFAAVPVIPGECPDEWEAHRARVVASLAPSGLLEVNLAERAGLLLWRLQRLARYEAEIVTADMEELEVPPLPPPQDQYSHLIPSPKQKTRQEQLQDLRQELRTARQELAEVLPAYNFFVDGGNAGNAVVPFEVVETILEAALGRAEIAEGLRTDPPQFESKKFLKQLGVTETDAENVAWTSDLIHRGLLLYAGFTQEPAEQFLESVRMDLEEQAEEHTRAVRRLDREAGAVARLLDNGITRHQVRTLLPSNGRDERIAKYERHLHTLLTSTLHELERLQARREGGAIPPPAVVDVNVNVVTSTD